MREIKFRLWDKEESVYIYPDEKESNNSLIRSWTDSEDETTCLEQFTGLRDKNGKEIYEGDIIRAEMALGEPPLIAPVIWYYSGFWLDHGMWHAWPDNIELREVIGNIHENPELLK